MTKFQGNEIKAVTRNLLLGGRPGTRRPQFTQQRFFKKILEILYKICTKIEKF